jgi:hypothetical protein
MCHWQDGGAMSMLLVGAAGAGGREVGDVDVMFVSDDVGWSGPELEAVGGASEILAL